MSSARATRSSGGDAARRLAGATNDSGTPLILPVYLDVPPAFANGADWVLTTLLAALGASARYVRDAGAADSCVLAYARRPVADVPTLPASGEAIDLIARRERLPKESFQAYAVTGSGAQLRMAPGPGSRTTGDRPTATAADDLVGAFPVAGDGFAVPFDLIASAFILLAAWDERTSSVRDRYGRLPFAESTFARNSALGVSALVRPPVDRYVIFLRSLLQPRLTALGLPRLPTLDWAQPQGSSPAGASAATTLAAAERPTIPAHAQDTMVPPQAARFAVALTHDVDNVRRWTARGLAGALKRAGQAARRHDLARARWEILGLLRAFVHDLPRGYDPSWTFPDLLTREDRAGVTSTFFVIASHGAAIDGAQPKVYHEHLPHLMRLLRGHAREVGLHGNQRDRDDAAALREDRAALAERIGATVNGMRYHYLRCLYHETLPLLDAEGFVYDSSLAFGEYEGYRCGFSHPFHPYDLAHDRPLGLVELPLAVMDSTLQERHYRGLAATAAREAAVAALEPLTRSGGAAAILWHHNRFDSYFGRGYDQVYWDLVDWIRQQGGIATSALDIVNRWKSRIGEATL